MPKRPDHLYLHSICTTLIYLIILKQSLHKFKARFILEVNHLLQILYAFLQIWNYDVFIGTQVSTWVILFTLLSVHHVLVRLTLSYFFRLIRYLIIRTPTFMDLIIAHIVLHHVTADCIVHFRVDRVICLHCLIRLLRLTRFVSHVIIALVPLIIHQLHLESVLFIDNGLHHYFILLLFDLLSVQQVLCQILRLLILICA